MQTNLFCFMKEINAWFKFKKTGTLVWANKKLVFGGSAGVIFQTMSKHLCVRNVLISQKNYYPSSSQLKIDFWGSPREIVPPHHVKVFVSSISTDIKKTLAP